MLPILSNCLSVLSPILFGPSLTGSLRCDAIGTMNHRHEMEFHVSRKSRDRYGFSELLFALSSNVIFANFHAARVFIEKINEKRDLVNFPERALKTGQLISMGLVD